MKHSMLKVGLALTSISILIVTILLFFLLSETQLLKISTRLDFLLLAPMKLRYRWECLLRQTEKVLL